MAFSTTNAVVLTGAITAAGTWASDGKLNIRIAIGAVILMFGLAALNEASPKFASRMAGLILVAAASYYGPVIGEKTGLITNKKTRDMIARMRKDGWVK